MNELTAHNLYLLPRPSIATKAIERNITDGFSEPKKKLLYYLKVMQQVGPS
jgi:hypothetical protein